MKNLASFAARFTEASTWACVASFLVMAGVSLPPGIWHDIVFGGSVIAAVLGVVIKEGWKVALTSGDAISALEAEVTTLKNPQSST
jgi:hypothetical protein